MKCRQCLVKFLTHTSGDFSCLNLHMYTEPNATALIRLLPGIDSLYVVKCCSQWIQWRRRDGSRVHILNGKLLILCDSSDTPVCFSIKRSLLGRFCSQVWPHRGTSSQLLQRPDKQTWPQTWPPSQAPRLDGDPPLVIWWLVACKRGRARTSLPFWEIQVFYSRRSLQQPTKERRKKDPWRSESSAGSCMLQHLTSRRTEKNWRRLMDVDTWMKASKVLSLASLRC